MLTLALQYQLVETQITSPKYKSIKLAIESERQSCYVSCSWDPTYTTPVAIILATGGRTHNNVVIREIQASNHKFIKSCALIKHDNFEYDRVTQCLTPDCTICLNTILRPVGFQSRIRRFLGHSTMPIDPESACVAADLFRLNQLCDWWPLDTSLGHDSVHLSQICSKLLHVAPDPITCPGVLRIINPPGRPPSSCRLWDLHPVQFSVVSG